MNFSGPGIEGIKRIEQAIRNLDKQEINDNSDEEFSDDSEADDLSLAERARKYLERRQVREKERAEELQEESLKEVRDKPLINKNSARLARPGRPPAQDVGLALYAKAQEESVDTDNHHVVNSPAITKQAAELVREGPVGDRLYQNAFDKNQRLEEKKMRQLSEEQVNKTRSATAMQHAHALYEKALESKRMKEETIKRREERLRKLAKPTIGSKTKKLAASMEQTPAERLMQSTGKPKKGNMVPSKEDAELTFKPKINPNSKKILSGVTHDDAAVENCPSECSTSTHDRLYQEYATRRAKRTAEEQEKLRHKVEEDLKQCTFKPTITQFAPLEEVRRDGTRDIVDRLNDWKSRRSERLERERELKEEESLRESSFSFVPKTNPTRTKRPSKPASNHRGFDEFVERQRRAREERSRAEREKSRGAKWSNKITVPIGPKLGTKARVEKKRIDKEREDEAVQEQQPAAVKIPKRTPPPPPSSFSPDERDEDVIAKTISSFSKLPYSSKPPVAPSPPSSSNNNNSESSPLQDFKILQSLLNN